MHISDSIKSFEKDGFHISKPVHKLPYPVETACRMVPIIRKPLNGFYDWQDGNYIMAAGMCFRAWNEHYEDFNDVVALMKNKPHRPDWQHPFWFIGGCELEKFKIGQKLRKYDKTLFDLSVVKKFLKKIGMTGFETEEHSGGHVFHKINGTKIARLLGTASARFPVLGAGLFEVMQIDTIRKSDKKIKDTLLSPLRVFVIIGLASIGGSAGKYHSRLAEFIGMGSGIILGSKIAKDYLTAGKKKPIKPKPDKKLNLFA